MSSSAVDWHRFHADPDPDPTLHVDADPNPDPSQHQMCHNFHYFGQYIEQEPKWFTLAEPECIPDPQLYLRLFFWGGGGGG
jgi:hypothetical protein